MNLNLVRFRCHHLLLKTVTYLNGNSIQYLMLSDKEREYVRDPQAFEKEHSEVYVRKMRNCIRRKAVIAITDLIDIYVLDHNEFGKLKEDDMCEHSYCRSMLGRKRKPLLECFTAITLDCFGTLHQHYEKNLEYMRGNMKFADKLILRDMKIYKILMRGENNTDHDNNYIENDNKKRRRI